MPAPPRVVLLGADTQPQPTATAAASRGAPGLPTDQATCATYATESTKIAATRFGSGVDQMAIEKLGVHASLLNTGKRSIVAAKVRVTIEGDGIVLFAAEVTPLAVVIKGREVDKDKLKSAERFTISIKDVKELRIKVEPMNLSGAP